ncbi:MAG: hypothetical protein H6828_02085 [Planctomycetes bacterium]|nr:hypothetical protein [Planctomycetota bacterium]
MQLADVCAMIEEAVQAVPGSVGEATVLGNLDGWDSMGLVIFIELTQDRAGAELAVHELRACQSPAEVAALIERTRAS